MKRTKITETVEYVEPRSMKLFRACAGVLVHGSRRIAMDANPGPGDAEALLEEFRPHVAFLSHYHIDHTIWARAAVQAGARVVISESEVPLVRSLAHFVERTAGPAGLTESWERFVTETAGYGQVPAVEPLRAGDGVLDCGVPMELVPTPGHSPGHTAVFFPRDRILFTGDMGLDRFGPWYGWVDCDLAKMVESYLRLKALDARVLLTSHGGVITKDIPAAWDGALGEIFRREGKVESWLDQGWDREHMVREGLFFPNKDAVAEPMRSFLRMWDGTMVDHHVKALAHGGLRSLFPDVCKGLGIR